MTGSQKWRMARSVCRARAATQKTAPHRLPDSPGETEHAAGDARLVTEGKHVRTEKAQRGVCRSGKATRTDIAAAAARSSGGGLKEGDGVVPADVLVGAGLAQEVDEVGAAAEQHVLRVDDFIEGGCL